MVSIPKVARLGVSLEQVINQANQTISAPARVSQQVLRILSSLEYIIGVHLSTPARSSTGSEFNLYFAEYHLHRICRRGSMQQRGRYNTKLVAMAG